MRPAQQRRPFKQSLEAILSTFFPVGECADLRIYRPEEIALNNTEVSFCVQRNTLPQIQQPPRDNRGVHDKVKTNTKDRKNRRKLASAKAGINIEEELMR